MIIFFYRPLPFFRRRGGSVGYPELYFHRLRGTTDTLDSIRALCNNNIDIPVGIVNVTLVFKIQWSVALRRYFGNVIQIEWCLLTNQERKNHRFSTSIRNRFQTISVEIPIRLGTNNTHEAVSILITPVFPDSRKSSNPHYHPQSLEQIRRRNKTFEPARWAGRDAETISLFISIHTRHSCRNTYTIKIPCNTKPRKFRESSTSCTEGTEVNQ